MKAALRYFGAKNRLAGWVNSFIPDHRVYVEPFGGSAAVLLNKPRSEIEVYNDIYRDVVNYFRVLRDGDVNELVRLLELTAFSREEYQQAAEALPDDGGLEAARRFLVRSFMCIASNGVFRAKGGFRWGGLKRVPSHAWDWRLFPDRLHAVADRLQGVYIENIDALEVMGKFDSPETVHYVDPPYMLEARTKDGRYDHEYTASDHGKLLWFLSQLKGKVMLSGYRTAEYAKVLKDWSLVSCATRASQNAPREECLWLNFELEQKLF